LLTEQGGRTKYQNHSSLTTKAILARRYRFSETRSPYPIQKMEKQGKEIATDMAAVKINCELNLSTAEKSRKQTHLFENFEKTHKQAFGKEEVGEMHTPVHKCHQP